MHPPEAEARWQLAETKKAKIQYKPGMFIVNKNIYDLIPQNPSSKGRWPQPKRQRVRH